MTDTEARNEPPSGFPLPAAWEVLTGCAQHVVTEAVQEASARERRDGRVVVQTIDLLVALANEPEARASELLSAFGVNQAKMERYSGGLSKEPPSGDGEVAISLAVKHTMEFAFRAAIAKRHDRLGTEHMLLGLLRTAGNALDMLEGLHVPLDALREHVEASFPARAPSPQGDPVGGASLDALAERMRKLLGVTLDEHEAAEVPGVWNADHAAVLRDLSEAVAALEGARGRTGAT